MPKPNLRVCVPRKKLSESFKCNERMFENEDYKINREGLAIKKTSKKRYISGNSSNSGSDDESPNKNSFIKSLNDLQFGAVLGSGQSSTVYKAYHIRTRKKVAVKVINIYDRSKRHQVLKEIHTLFQHKSHSLVRFHSAFYQKGSIYVVLDYMDCGSLGDVLKKVKKIPEAPLKEIAYSIGKGLEYLHKTMKTVHRDLKPENVVLSSRGNAKLTDFGISSQLDSSINMCRTVVGTYTYMSPERISGKEYSFKSDIWAFGLTILQAAIGEYPYIQCRSGVYIELIAAIVEGEPPSIPSRFSSDFKSFISMCLQKNPAKRPSISTLLKHPWLAKCSRSHMKTVQNWIMIEKVAPQKSSRTSSSSRSHDKNRSSYGSRSTSGRASSTMSRSASRTSRSASHASRSASRASRSASRSKSTTPRRCRYDEQERRSLFYEKRREFSF